MKIPGSIYKRKTSNNLYIKFKGLQIATGIPDSKEGRALAKEILQHIFIENLQNKNYLPKISKKISINEAFERFIEYQKLKRNSKKTIRTYFDTYQRILKPAQEFDNIDLAVRNYISSNQLKPATINTYLRYGQIFLNWCFSEKIINEEININKKYRLKAGQKEIEIYTAEEYYAIIENLRNKPKQEEFILLIQFLWNSGARISETLEIKMIDIDRKNGIIKIPNKINKEKIETIQITSSIAIIIDELKLLNPKREKLFLWQSGSTSRLNRKLSVIEKELGIRKEGRSFHSFRKSYATRLFENNIEIDIIKDAMRHKDIRTTLDIYKKSKNERIKESLETMK